MLGPHLIERGSFINEEKKTSARCRSAARAAQVELGVAFWKDRRNLDQSQGFGPSVANYSKIPQRWCAVGKGRKEKGIMGSRNSTHLALGDVALTTRWPGAVALDPPGAARQAPRPRSRVLLPALDT